jgi:hypothetical protein
MKIVGFNLTKIFVERKEKIEGKLDIKQSINIDDISKDKINLTENEIIKLNFTFSIDYSPDMAKIEFKGGLIIVPEEDELKKIMKEWKNKQVSEELRIPLFNFIMHKCNIKAISFEDDMSLPLHIKMPRVAVNNESK